jgi:hypothetical protein
MSTCMATCSLSASSAARTMCTAISPPLRVLMAICTGAVAAFAVGFKSLVANCPTNRWSVDGTMIGRTDPLGFRIVILRPPAIAHMVSTGSSALAYLSANTRNTSLPTGSSLMACRSRHVTPSSPGPDWGRGVSAFLTDSPVT